MAFREAQSWDRFIRTCCFCFAGNNVAAAAVLAGLGFVVAVDTIQRSHQLGQA